MAKYKSQKSCGVVCKVKKWMKNSNQSRHDTIKDVVDKALSGEGHGTPKSSTQ